MTEKKYNLAFELSDGTTKNVQFSVPYVEVGKDVPTYDEHKNVVEQISMQAKRITNLEKGVAADSFETDDSVAYVKSVPANSAPYAAISKVGGMTRKCTNLFSGGDLSFERSELVTLANPIPAGTYTISCTCTSTDTAYNYNSVTFNGGGASDGTSNVNIAIPRTGRQTKIVTLLSPVSQIRFNASESYATAAGYSATFKEIMLNAGETALPYEPYFAGLRHEPVTGLKITGKNIFGGEAFADKLVSVARGTKDETAGTVYVSAAAIGGKVVLENVFKENTPYTIILKCHSTASGYVSIWVKYTDGTSENIPGLTADTIKTVVHVTKADKTVQSLTGTNRTNDTFYYRECGIFEGAVTESDFEPYAESTFPIPTEVQAIEGYGWGSTEVVHNYVDWENKRFVKNVGCVDLSTLSWQRIGTRWVASVPNLRNSYAYFVCENYTPSRFEGIGENCIAITADVRATVKITDSAVKPTGLLYYGLATPEVTDISDILPADNLIEVEGSGTITFENEHGLAVPSEVIYQTKGAAV